MLVPTPSLSLAVCVVLSVVGNRRYLVALLCVLVASHHVAKVSSLRTLFNVSVEIVVLIIVCVGVWASSLEQFGVQLIVI